MAVELLLMGNPIELMDGDVANVPMQWIKAVMSKLKETIGDKKLLNLSVLGFKAPGHISYNNRYYDSYRGPLVRILRDDFVYGFKNSLELKAHTTMEKDIKKLHWTWPISLMIFYKKAKTVIGGSTAEEDLDCIVKPVIEELRKKAEEKLTICIASYDDFIKESDLKDVMPFSTSSKELEDANFVKKKIEQSVKSTMEPLRGFVKTTKEFYNYERMTCLFGSMNADEFKIGEHVDVTTLVDSLADGKKYQESAVHVTNTIFQRIDNELCRITSEDRRFNVKCVSDFIKIIDDIIAYHKAKNQYEQLKFNLLPPYNALVITHVVRYITIFLTRNEKAYNKRHSLRCRLENYKETALELFRGLVAKETEDIIAANFFQKVLVEK
ncbi:unnamed protein product [Mytilus edulis]|uniref:Uncharacterized protein n=1 Tax=Mytilus edulis TaxID=6550 RepID=A0A8S3TGP9_MYTED|nr:unnamed protein product [Mytilus edulis]